jgi:membrane protein DedA with SNARE-associated domain
MTGVPDAISAWGWWAAYAFLFFVVFLRAQGTYWLGRGVVSGALHTRWGRRFEGPTMQRAHAFLERFGPFGVPVSFLTVGFQTAVNAAAGIGRMRYGVYTLAMIPGCLAWAAIYTALGAAALRLFQTFTWWFAAALLLAIVAAIAVALTRRRRSGDSSARTPR